MLAVDKMLVQLSKKRLAGVPQIEPIRRDMLTDALGVYQKMLEDNPTEPTLRLAAGKAAIKVGDIQMLLGNVEAATTAYRRGIASLETLIADRPEMTEAVPELARAYDQADGDQDGSMTQNQAKQSFSISAKSQPDSKLLSSRRHCIRDDSVDPRHRQNQCEPRE